MRGEVSGQPAMKGTMARRKYLYNRSDFGPLPVKLEHLDIYLDFRNGAVDATNTLRMTALHALTELALDARELEIRSVERLEEAGRAVSLDYVYGKEKKSLLISLSERVEAGRTFTIRTRTRCIPSDRVLEGIYMDTTPPGCPQQYMSQCQQWGFSRIMPVIDDCRAKCTMTVAIEADGRYTHLISNGNADGSLCSEGVPVPVPDDPARRVMKYRNVFPMAPYLFIVCVGTWDVVADEVIYPSGRRVRLEYLVPPGRKDGAALPMKILKDSILWHGQTQEYEYRHDVYRTICMEKSNFGGMENVGNTTIVTSAALIDEFISDARLEYAYGVIIHEFAHNQCGSDVTMETPFDMWLNEAFTVDVERQYMMSRFDADWRRLDQYDTMRQPVGGPLAVEDGGQMGNIVRQGFNDPDEVVDGVTYIKAAEVIRMLKLLLGRDTFRRGKNLYFDKYGMGNANTDQFFACFEEVSGRNMSQFKREWLHTIGYPVVEGDYRHDADSGRLEVFFRQCRSIPENGGWFHIPIAMSAVDGEGRDLPSTSCIAEITGESLELVFEDVPVPAFVSFNRDCSFYGVFKDRAATPDSLVRQVRLDPNRFNRVEAMRRLTDIERVRLIEDPGADVGTRWLEVFGSILSDTSLPPAFKAYLLHIDEQSVDRRYLPCYRERYRARARLMKVVTDCLLPDLVKVFEQVDTYACALEPKDGLEERRLKAVLLRIITEADIPETHRIAGDHFRMAWNISDKVSALGCINISSHPDRLRFMQEGRARWADHHNAYSSYLAIVGCGTHDDVFDAIAAEEREPGFDIRHPTYSRALFLPMTSNNKMLWTDRGICWTAETIVRLARVNEYAAVRMSACFQHVHRLADDLKPKVIAALEAMCDRIDESACPSIAGRIRMYLEGK